jgi:integrase/recombinase XerD
MKRMKICTDDNLSFEQGYKEFIDSCKARNLRPGTITHYNESYKVITRYFDKNIDLKEIDKKFFEDFVLSCKKNKNIGEQTLHTYCRDLKTILYFFMKMEHMKNFKIELPKVDKKTIETYSDAELKILLKKPDIKKCTFAEYRDWVVINFLLSTGVRSNSLINIKIKEVDFENELVCINVTKNRKPLIIPLNSSIQKILQEYLRIRQFKSIEDNLFCTVYGGKLARKSLNGSLISYNNKRGVVKTGTHRYRHTFAKKYINSGGNPVYLQKLLGHSSLLTPPAAEPAT